MKALCAHIPFASPSRCFSSNFASLGINNWPRRANYLLGSDKRSERLKTKKWKGNYQVGRDDGIRVNFQTKKYHSRANDFSTRERKLPVFLSSGTRPVLSAGNHISTVNDAITAPVAI